MFKTILNLILIVFIFLAITGCGDDSSNPNSNKKDVIVYGYLETYEYWDGSQEYRFFSRAHGDHDPQQFVVQLSKENNNIELENGTSITGEYFTNQNEDFSFDADDEFKISADLESSNFSAELTTMSPIDTIIHETIADQIFIQWSNVEADYYVVEFYDWAEHKSYVVHDTSFSTYTYNIPDNNGYYTYIIVTAFNDQRIINDSDYYAYYFSISTALVGLDEDYATSGRRDFKRSNDETIKMLSSISDMDEVNSEDANSKCIYSFHYIYTYNSSQTDNNYFNGYVFTEPSTVFEQFSATINGRGLSTYTSSEGIVKIIESVDPEYAYWGYDPDLKIKLKLNINNVIDSAYVAIPDTFSIINIPDPQVFPMEFYWTKPENSDFYFVNYNWTTEDSVREDSACVIIDTSFTINSLPENILRLGVDITAINGANPLYSYEPNLEKHNGFFYSFRDSRNYVFYQLDDSSTDFIPVLKEKETDSLDESRKNIIEEKLFEMMKKKFPQLEDVRNR